jgi:hypothetical protein
MHYQLVRLLIHHSSDSMADILLFIILAQKLSSDIVARGLKVGRNLFKGTPGHLDFGQSVCIPLGLT